MDSIKANFNHTSTFWLVSGVKLLDAHHMSGQCGWLAIVTAPFFKDPRLIHARDSLSQAPGKRTGLIFWLERITFQSWVWSILRASRVNRYSLRSSEPDRTSQMVLAVTSYTRNWTSGATRNALQGVKLRSGCTHETDLWAQSGWSIILPNVN